MSIALSPFMRLLYGLDESGSNAVRANGAAANVTGDYSMTPWNNSTSDGMPVVDDAKGGKGCDIQFTPGAPWTSEARGMKTPDTTFQQQLDAGAIQDPADWIADTEGYTVGLRFKHTLKNKGFGGTDRQLAFGLQSEDLTGRLAVGLSLITDTNLSPATGLTPHIEVGGFNRLLQDNLGGWTTTNSPGTHPITDDGWYSIVMRAVYRASGDFVDITVWLRNETTGVTYQYDYSAAASLCDMEANSYTNDGWAWRFGSYAGVSGYFYGSVDQGWYYNAPLDDTDVESILISGLSIPWSEPNYNRDDHVVYSAVTKEGAEYPKTRVLPTGATICRHPVDVLCQEIRCRLEGWRAGEPWALRALDFVFDPAGPYGSQRARKGERPDLTVGVWRTPGRKPWGACEDSRNVEFTYAGPRRRRGFKIRRDVDSAAPTGHNAFWSWRSYDDELFLAYKAGTALYREEGSSASSISTGWSANEMPSAFFLDDRYIVLSTSKQVMLDGTATTQAHGAAAPASIAAAAAGGGTLAGSYYYAATLYDPLTGDETGPVVTTAVVSPATQKVTLTLPSSSPEARYTQYRIYRTTDGGTAPNFFLIKTATVAAAVDDTGEVDGVELLPQVTDSSSAFLGYITTAMPDTFALGISHKERAVYAKGITNPERIYFFEPNEPLRNYANQWIAADGPVRALASWQGRIVVFTDNTVEIVESDFVRDADGNLSINRTVISRSVGALGQGSVITFQGQIFWLDRRGVFTLQGTEAVPMSERIQDLFPYINTNLGAQIVGGWNHITRTLWWTLPQSAFQDNNTLMQTQFVMPLAEPEKWWFHDLEATFVGQFDDDLNGQRFGAIDHAGVFKELESYEGDGMEGDETGTFEDEGTDDFGSTPAGITSVTVNTFAVEGAPGWTTDEHRGRGLVLRDRSTGKLYYHTIRSNTSAGLTVERTPNAALAAGDGYYIGSMNAFLQFAGHDFGSPNRKVVRQVQYTFADLTKEDLYL